MTIRFTQSGKAVANFSLACRDRVRGANGEWEDGEPTFIRCTVWGKPAEHLAESARKGDQLIITGKLKRNQYERDGVKVDTLQVEVESIGVSLQWNEAKTPRALGTHTPGTQQAPAGDPWGTPAAQAQEAAPPW